MCDDGNTDDNDEDKFWENEEQREHIKYLIVQHEVGEQGTPHLQGFLILKRQNRMTWLKSNINGRAHWEKAKGTQTLLSKTTTYGRCVDAAEVILNLRLLRI